MNALLVPLSGTKSPKIRIEGRVFAVGRKEPSFAGLSGEDSAVLSRRHAQFFEEEQRLYLVDLGSEQGTRVNGELLIDRPVLLRADDVIAFGSLEFRVDTGKVPTEAARIQTKFVSIEDDNTEILVPGGEVPTEVATAGLTRTEMAHESAPEADESSTVVLDDPQPPGDITLARPTDRASKTNRPRTSKQSQAQHGDHKQKKNGDDRRPGLWQFWPAAVLLPIILVAAYFLFRTPPPMDGDTVQNGTARPFNEAVAMVESALDQGDTDTLPARLLHLVHSNVGDIRLRQLLDDATRYCELLSLRENSELLRLATLRGNGPLGTALFEDAARSHIDPALGPTASQQRLAQAAEAWGSGRLVEAINLLIEMPDNAFAAAMLNHYRSVVEHYETLNTLSGSPAYPQAASTFYLSLNPMEDGFFWRRLAGDSEASQQPEFRTMAKQLEAAAALWTSYHINNRISGRMRQQADISEAFRQRSYELRETSANLKAVAVTLPQPPGSSAQLFPEMVNAEIQKQRDRLLTLQAFNSDPVLAEKLGMLNIGQNSLSSPENGRLTESL